MGFSFFRKHQDNEAKPAPRAAPSAAKAGQPLPATRTPASTQPSLAVAAVSGKAAPASPPPLTTQQSGFYPAASVPATEMASVVEEAAVLYASNYADQAATLLLEYTKSDPAEMNAQPWLMLFEIFQIQGKKSQFEELAMEFVVRFERSAPIWSDAKVFGAKAAPAAAPSSAEGYVSFSGVLSGDKDSFFQNMMQTAQKGGGLRLDFSRMEGVEASGSRRLVETLQDLKKSGKKITPVNAPVLADLLKELIGQGGEDEQAHWQLLLSLYQCQGMQAEFEDLAVEYAVTFEVSPPSWEPISLCKEPVAVAEPSAAPRDEDAFYLSGVISTGSEHQFQEISRFAATHAEVYLDMSDVPRVDFVSIGDFVGVLAGLKGSGKKVLIRNANEMIRALFGIMGVDQLATIQRRKIG